MRTHELFSFVSTLSGVTRFSMLKAVHTETVLEHTGMIACFAFVIGTRLNQLNGFQFNMEKLLSKAIVHDWDESITGDVARPTKYFSQVLRNELHALEAGGIDSLSDALFIKNLPSLHAEAKEDEEGCLVDLCDIACAIHRCWEEVLVFNNMHFTLPAPRLRLVLHKKFKSFQLGKMSSGQWQIIDKFVMDLNGLLNEIVRSSNGKIMELSDAN